MSKHDSIDFLSIPDKTVFHYTSEEGFKGIIHSKAIWCTDIRSLTDSSELHYGIEFTQRQIERLKITLPEDSELLTEISSDLSTIHNFNYYGIFVCSFCADDGNGLDQWRSYADDGNGFSIGFAFSMQEFRQRLEYSAGAQGLWFAKCVYNLKKQTEIVHSSLMEALDEFHKKGGDQDAAMFASVSFQMDFYYKIATRLKHPKFSREREWRLVLKIPLLMDDLPIQYRRGKSGTPIPYVEYGLNNETQTLSLAKIFVGPKREHYLASPGSVHSYLSSERVVSHSVRRSNIPYRSL